MKKEKQVRAYTRKTKSGRTVTVRAHKASYDAAEEVAKEIARRKGAGEELTRKKTVKEQPMNITPEDFREWYNSAYTDNYNEEAVNRVEKILKKKLGAKGYKAFDEQMQSYGARGWKKAHQSMIDEQTERQKKQDAEGPKSAKPTEKAEPKTMKNGGTISHRDGSNFWTKDIKSKKVGDQFVVTSDVGPAYKAQFVTDKEGNYKLVINTEDGNRWATAIWDDIDSHKSLPKEIRKAAEAQGLTFSDGKFVRGADTTRGSQGTPKRAISADHVRRYADFEDIDVKTARKELSEMSDKEYQKSVEIYAKEAKKDAKRTTSIRSGKESDIMKAMTSPFRGAAKRLTGKDATEAKKSLIEDGFEQKKGKYGDVYLKKGNSIYQYTPAGVLVGGAHLMKVSGEKLSEVKELFSASHTSGTAPKQTKKSTPKTKTKIFTDMPYGPSYLKEGTYDFGEGLTVKLSKGADGKWRGAAYRDGKQRHGGSYYNVKGLSAPKVFKWLNRWHFRSL